MPRYAIKASRRVWVRRYVEAPTAEKACHLALHDDGEWHQTDADPVEFDDITEAQPL